MKNKPDREWLDGEVTITREELGKIMAEETKSVLLAVKNAGDNELYGLLKDLLQIFCANIGVEVFKKLEEEREEF